MTTIVRAQGVVLDLPEDMTAGDPDAGGESVASPRGRRAPGQPVPMPDANAAQDDGLVRAMTEQGLHLLDSFELRTSSTGTPRAGGGGHAKVKVELDADEDAVLLLAQDGIYSWRYAADSQEVTRSARTRGPLVMPGAKRLVFDLAPAPAAGPRPQRRGLIEDLAGAPVRAWVMKFVARHVLTSAIRVLERNVRHRLIHIQSAELDEWMPLDSPDRIQMPNGRSARILLLVHGAFSSTAGSFHALCATAWGRDFLTTALGAYDLVLGFDHPTLGHDPLENATELLAALESLGGGGDHSVDVIGFSRGCMVTRSLSELLLPATQSRLRIRHMVLVGGTHLGTRLAEPDNWECLADLYTNLAVDACRLLQLFPGAAPAATVLRESLASLGALVKYLAVAALKERCAPGLAALAPSGEFVTRLGAGQHRAAFESFYYLVSSEFDAALAGRDEGLPERLVGWLLDVAADRFMACTNDLVVDLASMSLGESKPGVFVQGRLDFGPNPCVHHTVYFIRPELTRAMTGWLNLGSAGDDAGRGAQGWLAWAIPEPAILHLPATAPLSALPARGVTDAPEYLVLERRDGASVGFYIRSLAAVNRELERLPRKDRGQSLLDALADTVLALHPGHPSPVQHRGTPVPDNAPRELFVLLEDEAPVAVAWPPGRASLARLQRLLTPGQGVYRGAERRARPRESDSGEALRRRAGRARETAPAGQPDRFYFGASMKERIPLGRTETLRLTISRDRLDTARAAAGGQFDADTHAMLIVQLIPKSNLEIVGEDRFQLAPQSVENRIELAFDLRGTSAGTGELWVLVRHGALTLATLQLRTEIVQEAAASPHCSAAAASTTLEEASDAEVPVLQIFERRNGDSHSYLFALDLGDGNYLTADSAPLRTGREAYVEALYREIEERWLGCPADFAAFGEELRAFGGVLFDQLIPAPIQRALWPLRDRLRAIHVLSEEPFIPWELVHLKPPPVDGRPQPLPPDTHFLGQKGLVRWLHNHRNAPRRVRVRSGHAFHCVPDYPHPDYELPAAQEEIAFLEAELGSHWAGADSASLRALLREPGRVDLFHFSGHGEAEAQKPHAARVLLEGRVEGRQYLPDYLRSEVVEQHARLCAERGNRPVVVLNACQIGRAGWHLTSIGGFAEAFLRAGAGVFVGTLWAVGDRPAKQFTEAFYAALKSGKCLADAATAARERAREAGEATWLAYAVYGHPQAVVRFEA